MTHSHHRSAPLGTQTGATLVVGLILLLVLTVLGVSGMSTARMEIQMAGNTQFQQDAFQQAETGIDVVLAQRSFSTSLPTTVSSTDDPNYARESTATFQMTTPVPNIAFSMGTSPDTVSAYHFDIESTGHGSRNATSTHTQGFFVVGPGGN
jgi:type IV pilus assembly protein PilX